MRTCLLKDLPALLDFYQLVIEGLWEASHNSSYEKCFVMGSTSLKAA